MQRPLRRTDFSPLPRDLLAYSRDEVVKTVLEPLKRKARKFEARKFHGSGRTNGGSFMVLMQSTFRPSTVKGDRQGRVAQLHWIAPGSFSCLQFSCLQSYEFVKAVLRRVDVEGKKIGGKKISLVRQNKRWQLHGLDAIDIQTFNVSRF